MKSGIWGAIFLCVSFVAIGAQTPSAPVAPPAAAGASAHQGAVPAAVQGEGPIQPIPFSHKEHAGNLKIPCQYCHAPKKNGATLTIPQAKECMVCHSSIATSNPGVQTLTSYARSGKLIPWVRVYQLPSFVSFSHKEHLTHGVTCQQCHGDVAKDTRIFQATDISMGGCLKCHQAKKASIGCDTCHEIDD